ncbi:hypothetical protein EFR84_30245 [Rhizobium chutanense]|uniref:Uncharacterized protein n=1 Tax=Rhizobium chutanense TaxID=2035448 RepID=A0A432NDQ4_9HYPH|nr:hypothetical protein EFR84_30245 [Rhizobium chutanense]
MSMMSAVVAEQDLLQKDSVRSRFEFPVSGSDQDQGRLQADRLGFLKSGPAASHVQVSRRALSIAVRCQDVAINH